MEFSNDWQEIVPTKMLKSRLKLLTDLNYFIVLNRVSTKAV